MAKKAKPEKAKADAKPAEGAPGKRSKVKLAALVVVPLLLLGGGGFAGWTFFLKSPEVAAGHGEEAVEAGTDHIKVSAVPLEVAAETSFTHSFALSVLVEGRCGSPEVPALRAASEKEAAENAGLMNASWMAAARRTVDVTEKSCTHFWREIEAAEAKAGTKDEPAPKAAAH